MQFRHGYEISHWDHNWDQWALFLALSVITREDFAPKILISANQRNAFGTAW